MNLRLAAEDCARSLLRIYESQPLHGVRVERLWTGSEGDEVEVDVYVKSTLEPSIDEIPVLQAILEGLQGVRVTVYSYDPVADAGRGGGYVAFRLVERGLRMGKPFILVLPGQRSLVLAGFLEEDEWQVIEESLAIKATVTAGNILYLPEPGAAGKARLVAKLNSEQSYERVRWLTRIAGELGVRLGRPLFLQSNREIFEHVFSLGRRGPLERVPVNKLAAYTSTLAECGYLDGIRRLTRIEASTHYIYAHRVPGWLLDRVAERLETILSIELRGTLYSLAFQGASKVFEDILSRIGS